MDRASGEPLTEAMYELKLEEEGIDYKGFIQDDSAKSKEHAIRDHMTVEMRG